MELLFVLRMLCNKSRFFLFFISLSLLPPADGTSTLRLSSVRELPSQLHDLYQQGFVLAAVHPFIHPCGPESNSPQHQLYRAILVRLNDGYDATLCQC